MSEEVLDGSLHTAARTTQSLDISLKLEKAHIIQLPKLVGISLLWGPVIGRLWSTEATTPKQSCEWVGTSTTALSTLTSHPLHQLVHQSGIAQEWVLLGIEGVDATLASIAEQSRVEK